MLVPRVGDLIRERPDLQRRMEKAQLVEARAKTMAYVDSIDYYEETHEKPVSNKNK